MRRDLTPSEPRFGGDPQKGPEGRKRSVRPGVVVAVLVAAVLITFVVQNGREVPVTWLFVEVNGPLWAVIIAAAVAGAVLSEVLGWVVRRVRGRRGRDGGR